MKINVQFILTEGFPMGPLVYFQHDRKLLWFVFSSDEMWRQNPTGERAIRSGTMCTEIPILR